MADGSISEKLMGQDERTKFPRAAKYEFWTSYHQKLTVPDFRRESNIPTYVQDFRLVIPDNTWHTVMIYFTDKDWHRYRQELYQEKRCPWSWLFFFNLGGLVIVLLFVVASFFATVQVGVSSEIETYPLRASLYALGIGLCISIPLMSFAFFRFRFPKLEDPHEKDHDPSVHPRSYSAIP